MVNMSISDIHDDWDRPFFNPDLGESKYRKDTSLALTPMHAFPPGRSAKRRSRDLADT